MICTLDKSGRHWLGTPFTAMPAKERKSKAGRKRRNISARGNASGNCLPATLWHQCCQNG
eukprot:12089402-Karenia_brevis.AAC.1